MSASRTFNGLTVDINEDLCIGSGNCVSMAPDVFRLNEESVVEFTDDPEGEDPDVIVEACALCPVDALSVIDEQGEQIVP